MRFDSYHPTINFIFFVIVLASAIGFTQPVFLLLTYATSFVYSVKLGGKKALIFNLILVPLVVVWAFWYAYYNHFGVTNLWINVIGNMITLEALAYGFVTGIIAASVVMWFSCIHVIISTDKVIYLLGRIAPRLSLFVAILLRLIPRIKARAKKIALAQRCIGRGMDRGNIFRRIYNFFRIASIVITWTLENLVETSDSMRSRGYTLRGRTAFSIYRFDNRDRGFVIAIFWCAIIVLMGVFLDQTRILYNPQIMPNRITPLSFVFYAAYAFLCLLPMNLQIAGEYRFDKLRNSVH